MVDKMCWAERQHFSLKIRDPHWNNLISILTTDSVLPGLRAGGSGDQSQTPPSWRTTPFWLSATAYSIYPQLPFILVAVSTSATRGRAVLRWQGPTDHGTVPWIYRIIQTTDYGLLRIGRIQFWWTIMRKYYCYVACGVGRGHLKWILQPQFVII